MRSKRSGRAPRVLISIIMVAVLTAVTSAQDDGDPNSPTPVLLSEARSTRALAVPARSGARIQLSTRIPSRPFDYESNVVLFLTNVSLMKGEGANAFRVYVEDAGGKKYRFPVVDIRALDKSAASDAVFALTVTLKDVAGFWAPPADSGDVFIGVTWRGMISNRVLLGIGRMGEGVKEDPDSAPTPPGKRYGARSAAGDQLAQNSIGYQWSGDRVRLLQQATFGPTAALDSRLRRVGIRMWLTEQLDAQYPSPSNPYPNHPLKPGNPPSDCDNNQTVPDVPATCARDTYSMYQPQIWFMKEALYGNAQLRHRVAWALAQIWVTSGTDIQQGRHMVEYHKVLANNAFGNYRTLMEQMTLNPTMGQYLDMMSSTRNNPNENFAREIMQLFTIGLFMLNQDGTYQLDETGSPIPTYDQNVVNDLTKVLTGWRDCRVPASCPNIAVNTVNYIDPMMLNAGITNAGSNLHDLTAKTLLSYLGSTTTNIPVCPTSGASNCTTTGGNTNAQALANIATYANNSMDQALDNIFHHPNVGPFISKILIQHLVTSDPTPAYVGRVAGVFNNNGLGERGDMKAVVRAILLDPEARGEVKTDPNFGKLREPVLLATNLLRQFNVRSADGLSQSDGYFIARGEFTGMGQIPFMSPTVFNFYPPSYVIPGTAMLGPEFAIMTTGTAIQRTNFVNRFVFTSIPVAVSVPNTPNGTSLDFNDLQAISTADLTGSALVDEVGRRMLHGTMSSQMRSTLLTAVTSFTSGTDMHLNRVRQAVYLIATSSQYQVQR